MSIIEGISKNILNNGDISWFGTFRDPSNNNMPTRKKLGSKKKDKINNEKQALLVLEKLKAKLQNYNKAIEENIKYHNYLTLSQLADKYFEDKQIDKKEELRGQFPDLKTDAQFESYSVVKDKLSNLNKQRLLYYKHIGRLYIANISVNEITKTLAKEYRDKHLRRKKLSQKSKSNIINLIKSIINYSIKQDTINIPNPFQNISIKHDNNQRDRALSEEELKLLLDICKEYKESINVYLSVYLAVLTAGRSNTILNIKKNDIDTKNNTITLYNFKANRKYRLGLNQVSVDWLKNKILPHYENDEFLIRPINEQKRIKPYQPFRKIPLKVYKIMDNLFNQHLDKSNNSDRDNVVNFHTLRRSVATNLAKNGTSLYDIMILLNHSNIEQTIKYLNQSNNNLNCSVDTFLSNVFN